ncbi:MAG TPA: DUF2911 domain-containing protein [Rubricoccaceae bacterium]|nr:DUF2911 domain-containing protein [Rubricoccaceae bacterium]
MRLLPLVLAAVTLALPAGAQQLRAPRTSPHARVSQTVGLTELTVDYHRPAVNERTIWGDLVPYDEVWRAGANENTVFETSTDITVEGQPLPAGRYGFHAIPGRDTWTLIFSTMADAWGSYSYTETEDALRVTVTPREALHQERLEYRFEDLSMDAATVVLHWERLAVPFTVRANTPEITLASMRRELRGSAGFSWQGWNQIASYAAQHRLALDEALGWAERSIEMNRNVTSLATRGDVLAALGRTADARAAYTEARAMATPEQQARIDERIGRLGTR